MTSSQQGGKRLMSTLLLFFAAYVGLPPNNPWSPYTLAHQPSQSLAHTQQNGLNKKSMDELGYNRIFTHHDELWFHAAILACLFSGGFLQWELPRFVSCHIHEQRLADAAKDRTLLDQGTLVKIMLILLQPLALGAMATLLGFWAYDRTKTKTTKEIKCNSSNAKPQEKTA